MTEKRKILTMISKAYAKQFSALLSVHYFQLFADYGSRLMLFPVTACRVILTDEKNKQFSNVLAYRFAQ
jgi:hypothetical protein